MGLRVNPSAVSPQSGIVDTFENKVGDWAYKTSAPSLHTEQQELQGRFAIAPQDSQVIDYLEESVSKIADLPVAHRYDGALRQAIAQMGDFPKVQAILQADLERREWFMARKMEQVFL